MTQTIRKLENSELYFLVLMVCMVCMHSISVILTYIEVVLEYKKINISICPFFLTLIHPPHTFFYLQEKIGVPEWLSRFSVRLWLSS